MSVAILAQANSHLKQQCAGRVLGNAMPMVGQRQYVVYKLMFQTRAGSSREYVGFTGCLDVRLAFHKRQPPAWVRCRKVPGDALEWEILERTVASKALALALEAYHACRLIAARPHAVRGGPWVRPTLPKGEMACILELATVRLATMLQRGADDDSTLLHRHLRGLRFGPSAEAPQGAATARGVFVCASRSGISRQSGACGSRDRARRILADSLQRGSAAHVRSKRGVCPRQRRLVENRKRRRGK